MQRQDWPAIASYLQALPADRWDGEAHFAQGLCLAFGPINTKNLPAAVVCLENACRLDPGNWRYRNTLSEFYLQVKRPAMALHAATIASMQAPADPLAAIALGKAAWLSGEPRLAWQVFSALSEQIPEDRADIRADLNALLLPLQPFWQQPCQGKRLALVRLAPGHREFLLACRRNAHFQRQYHRFQASHAEAVDQEINDAQRPPLENKKINWVIERQGRPIGLAALVDVDMANARAELLIGFPERPALGLGLEATLLAMEFAFSTLGLAKLLSYVYADNPGSQANTLHLGFRQEGCLISHIADPCNGQRLDLYVNGCLAEAFFENAKLLAAAEKLLGRRPHEARFSSRPSTAPPEILMAEIARALSSRS